MLMLYTCVYICVGMYIRFVCYTLKYTILLYTLNFTIYYTLLYYVYIDELKAFGISEEDLFRCRVTDKYKLFMKFQIQRARDYYNLAKKGMHLFSILCMCYIAVYTYMYEKYCYITHVLLFSYTYYSPIYTYPYTNILYSYIHQESLCSHPTVDSPYKLHSTYTLLYSML